MAESSAKVTSIQSLDEFHAKLLVYIERAGRLLDDVSGDVSRTRTWLETDRLSHWKREVRKKEKIVSQAQQELMTARLSEMPEAIQSRRIAVNKAKDQLRQAEEGLKNVRTWIRRYPDVIEPRTKVVNRMRQFLAYDLRRAAAYLQEASKNLSEYAEMRAPGRSESQPLSGDVPSTEDTAKPGENRGGPEGGGS